MATTGTKPTITRTEWAELGVERLLSVPLVSEFVFRSPKHNDPDEKEVIDHFIVHAGQSILLSQKAQEDPDKRNPERNELWVLKNIQNALKPIRGVIRNPADRPKWCEHPRRGRVEFARMPPVIHGVALAETWRPVDLSSASADLPMEYLGVPLTYMSINDFLNVVVQLRTVPELLEYLTARRALPESSLRVIGDEWVLFQLYLANSGSFYGCTGHGDARQKLEADADAVTAALGRNAENRFYSGLLEHVANALAVRDPNYAVGIDAEWASLFDPDGKRRNYLLLQGILVDLRLRERAELGRAFFTVIDKVVSNGKGLCFQASHIDGRDRAFLFVAARRFSRSGILEAVHTLTGGALAYFKKSSCLAIVDRDGKHYDLLLTRPGYVTTTQDEAAGRQYFGSLRMRDVDVSRL